MKETNRKPPAEISAFFARIQGRVQGVGFRYACLTKARSAGLLGWVQNTDDGAVEVWSEGSPEKQEDFLKWLCHGPPGAQVDSVQYNVQTPTEKYHNFSIK